MVAYLTEGQPKSSLSVHSLWILVYHQKEIACQQKLTIHTFLTNSGFLEILNKNSNHSPKDHIEIYYIIHYVLYTPILYIL